jgi:NADH-quinone oxidoreductase subunit A
MFGASRREVSVFTLSDYLPIVLMFVVAFGFAAGNVLLSQFVGQHKATRTKTMPYECGKDPVGSAHERFSVKFYLIAMIFILFDIELIFLIPWAVVFRTFITDFRLGSLIYVEMILFIALLLVGYVYVLKKGLFEWGVRARREAEAESRALALADARRKADKRAAAVTPARAA